MQDTVVIPANAHRVYRVTGKFFGVISCTAAFQLEVGRLGVRDMVAGRRFGGPEFKRLTFKNTSAAENTIVFEAGNSELDISSAIAADVQTTSFIKDAPTTIVARAETTIAATSGEIVVTVGALQRKQIAISNGSTTAGDVLLVVDPTTDQIGGFIQPGQTYTLITSSAITIWNQTANIIPLAILETFYDT